MAKEAKWTRERAFRTHNWPVPMWEAIVRIEGEPFAVAVRRTEHEANQISGLLAKVLEMADRLHALIDGSEPLSEQVRKATALLAEIESPANQGVK